jgi:two-component system, chemotaxis family, sensor histidine kinase and response regulator PixL
MYIDPELRDRVYQLFSLEVPKMLQTIETELVTLSIDRSATKVNNLLRAAHSIKGSAASLGLETIADLAHQIEDIFRVLNHPDLPFDRKLEQLLFQIYDCLNQVVMAEIQNEILSPGFHTRTQIVLANLDEEIGHFVIAGQQVPDGFLSSGVDLTQSIFEVDVAQSLVRLERVLLDPACHPIAVGEFRAQSEVFTGIATLTNTPGFGTIAHATIAALDRHPDRAREICCFALVDFYAGLETVLTGDSPEERLRQRAACGTISPGFAFLIAESPQSISPTVAITTSQSHQIQSVRSGDLFDLEFDLEDVFDRDLALDLIFNPEDDTFEPFDFGESAMIANSPELSVDDWLLSDLDDPHLIEPLSFSVRTLPLPTATEFDFPIAKMFSVPEIAAGASLNFDLVDIFDLAADRSHRLPEIAVFLPELDDQDCLNFDLVDIFDDPFATNIYQQHLGGSIADLTSNFDRLAPISAATFDPPARVIKPIRAKKTRKIAQTPIPQLSVRVGLDRLERMNNLMGELAIERHGLDLSNEQFSDTLERLRSKCENFQTIGDRLRQIADTLAISTQPPQLLPNIPNHLSELSPHHDLSQQFDVLELDRYNEVHQIAQATIEQLAQIEEQIEDLSLFATQSHHQIDRQKQLLSHLRDDLMWARMLPLGEILNRFPRTLHDLSIEFDKPVDLKITGAGVLVDRAAIDKLLDPLVQLLRNAFDHGIDFPAARQAMGKSPRGSIAITAYHQGSQTAIEIADDGRGIDLNAIKAKAISLGLLSITAAATAPNHQILDLLFTPGFSTADRVTKLSGRGMGLDIVKEQIQAIKGTISIDSQLGRGTTFTLRIPLTLTIAQLMVCQVGNAVYAFPADSIQKIVVPTAAQLTQQDSQPIFHWRDLTIPVYKLADLLTYSIPVPERTISHTLKSGAINPADWLSPLLLIRRANGIVALQIDRMITEQELTIKPFGASITPPSYSYGCTILGDGIILPVLDPHTLIQVLVERPSCPIFNLPPAPITISSNSILVIDDSITTRQSLCLTLEKFGYRTLQAKDGQEALQILRQKTSEIKLVICDVEMPNMNGFEFLNVYRQDQTLTHIPVAMLTSRSNTKHRQFAAHLGAVDYFIKPYVEQDLMAAIGKLVNGEW